MKSVTLIRQYDQERRIPAIKALRAATGMGLREAKDTCDLVLGIRYGGPSAPMPQTVAVYEDRPDVMDDLREQFELGAIVPRSAFTTDIPREDVLYLLLDAAAHMDSEAWHRFKCMPSYRAVSEAL